MVRPVAQRSGEWASASRTFPANTTSSSSFSVRLLCCLSSFSSPCCSTSSCLPAEINTLLTVNYFLAVKASPPDDDWFVEMARLVALRYGGQSASVLGCLSDGIGTLYRLFSVT